MFMPRRWCFFTVRSVSQAERGKMAKSQTTVSLGEIARRLDQAGTPWAVFAGAAASAYGATRPLTDVDILIASTDGERVATLFPEGEVKQREDGSVHIVQLPGFDLVAGLAWHQADATYVFDLDDAMAARLQRHEIGGIPVPVIPPEDNILFKAIADRGPEVGKHDWEDVQAMMAHLPEIDWEYLRWRAKAGGLGTRVQQAVARLEALRSGMENGEWRMETGD
jgi:hypothetical protein